MRERARARERESEREEREACERGVRGAWKTVRDGLLHEPRQPMAAHHRAEEGAGPRGAAGAFGTGYESTVAVQKQPTRPRPLACRCFSRKRGCSTTRPSRVPSTGRADDGRQSTPAGALVVVKNSRADQTRCGRSPHSAASRRPRVPLGALESAAVGNLRAARRA